MNKVNLLGAIALLASSCVSSGSAPSVTGMVYCDANTTLPSIELTQIEQTDSTTVLSLMGIYDYYDVKFSLGDEITLEAGGVSLPLKDIRSVGTTAIRNNAVDLLKGVPAEFQLVFPAVPRGAKIADLIQKTDGKIQNSIWGIDLTGRRSPDEMPAEIPSELLEHNFNSGNLPSIVLKDGVAKITAHAVAWRKWMNPEVKFVVNSIDDVQEIITTQFDSDGVVTIELPLAGTAQVMAMTPYNTYSSFKVDPDEEINLYVMPDNHSDAQRFIRPDAVTDGKYREVEAMKREFVRIEALKDEDADVLLLDKTDTDEYFKAMMKIYNDGVDSIKAANYPPDMEKYALARQDRKLLAHMLNPDAYTPRDWDLRDAAISDSVLRFSPEQVKEIRSKVDFTNPLLEVVSIGNIGNRSGFLKAKKLLLAGD